ncbi:hypothetical protein JKF63_07673 [Porcisia hertigi]|uniref:EDRF1 N-terminal domain-containing protein n=1 Tax=Porcisia hertigi TaxID=2761500 RepID=A0A836IDT8_9TRYP|nr:hypothetical protein JKF63_07673 [Porcisia hertigi]
MSSDAPPPDEKVRRHDEDGLGKANHRTKHRKEVKRYHQRQLNKQLREEAKARDAQLFLFEPSERVVGSTEETHADAHEAGRGVATGTSSALTTVLQRMTEVVPTAADNQPLRRTPPQRLLQNILSVPTSNAAAVAATGTHEFASNPPAGWDFEFLLRAPRASASAAPSPSAGNGVDSCATDATTVLAVADATVCRSLSVLEPFESHAVVDTAQRGSATPLDAASRDSNGSAIRRTGDQPPPDPCVQPHSNPRSLSSWERISVHPIYSGVSSTITKLLTNTQVQRIDGVKAIPMQAPLAPGTDINQPPRTYLTLDPIHNVHQHAPGFLRNERVALQHMLANAVMEWKDMQQNALIVSSAEAMRTIFEQVYVPERPLALHVQRIGPTLVIDSRASEPSGVREMRQEALFGKVMYRMKETYGRDASAADEAADGAAAGAAGQLALALPERRLTSMASSDVHFGAHLHRYSQVLRWRMDTTEVLVGTDAPIVLDQRSNTEQLVRVKEKTPVGSADEEQREALRSWFDAMMANVLQIGTYVHHDGIVQSHQVKKTMDILSSTEARMAAAALSFTSSVLQWLVKQCHRDGGTYAVVRDYASDYVELFELPDLDESTAFVEETDKYFGCPTAPTLACVNTGTAEQTADGAAYIEREVQSTPFSGYGIGGTPTTAHHLHRFNWNFGKTCFNIGQHIFRGGDANRAGDALSLLHRSLRILLPSCRENLSARETVAELVEMVPVLVARKLQVAATVASSGTANSPAVTAIDGVAGLCSSPEVYRDALLLCGRFEIPLQHMFVEARDLEGSQLMKAFYAQCLVACSAAVGTVVALSLEAYCSGCHHLRALRMARGEAKAKANKGNAELRVALPQEGAMTAISSSMQDLLQVVVEGLVRLEETSELLGPLHSTARATANPTEAPSGASVTEKYSSVHRATPDSRDGEHPKEGPLFTTAPLVPSRKPPLESYCQSMLPATPPAHTCAQSGLSECSRGADVGAVPVSCSTVLDPRTQVNLTPLRSALCELYGDVALVAMSDAASGFSVRVLTELGTRLEARLQQRGGKLPTTLVWLTTLKADVVSLSFSALRFYNRLDAHTRRHLVKLAFVYYLLGKEHHRTARYTKALEALHRAKSHLHASQKAADDIVFGAVFGSRDMFHWADVMRLLGDVYRSIVERKLDSALGIATVTLQQPLLVGPLHDLPQDADDFFTQALSVYTQGGTDKACRLARSYTLLLYASVLMERFAVSGTAAPHSASQRIAQLLREAEELAPTTFVKEREWHTLHLFTVTSTAAQDTALVRAVEEILLRTTTARDSPVRQSVPAVVVVVDGCDYSVDPSAAKKESNSVDADIAEWGGYRRERFVMPPTCPTLVELQKALVCCTMVERETSGRYADTPQQQPSHSRPQEAKRVVCTEAKYRGLLRWVGRAAGYLTSVLDYHEAHNSALEGTAVRHQWQSVLHSWGEREAGAFIHRMVSMIALRVLGAAQTRLAGVKQQEARGAIKQIACALSSAATLKAGGAGDTPEVFQQLLRDMRAFLVPFVGW